MDTNPLGTHAFNPVEGVMIRAVIYLQPGFVGLEREGKMVWCGKLEELPENLRYDCMVVNDSQFEEIKNLIPEASTKARKRAKR